VLGRSARWGLWVVVFLMAGTYLLTQGIPVWYKMHGQGLLIVTSGSMAPAFAAGDAVVLHDITDPAELRVGQVVTFWPAQGTNMVTHRVTSMKMLPVLEADPVTGSMVPTLDPLTNEPILRPFIMTKGDANATEDPNATQLSKVRGIVLGVHPGRGGVNVREQQQQQSALCNLAGKGRSVSPHTTDRQRYVAPIMALAGAFCVAALAAPWVAQAYTGSETASVQVASRASCGGTPDAVSPYRDALTSLSPALWWTFADGAAPMNGAVLEGAVKAGPAPVVAGASVSRSGKILMCDPTGAVTSASAASEGLVASGVIAAGDSFTFALVVASVTSPGLLASVSDGAGGGFDLLVGAGGDVLVISAQGEVLRAVGALPAAGTYQVSVAMSPGEAQVMLNGDAVARGAMSSLGGNLTVCLFSALGGVSSSGEHSVVAVVDEMVVLPGAMSSAQMKDLWASNHW
jgi:signal peptidase I